MHFLSAILYAALAFTSLQPQNSGLEWNRKSTLSTDRPVEFPGTVLEAGIYIVRLRQAGDRRSFVDILNQDETQVLASVVAVPDHRQRPDGTSEFTFHEVQGDGAKPVQTWYFPGDLVGLEFVYPKARAKEIAHGGEGYVMASNGSKDAVIVAVTPNGKEVVIDSPITQTARQKPQ